jgi:hypothetical protein
LIPLVYSILLHIFFDSEYIVVLGTKSSGGHVPLSLTWPDNLTLLQVLSSLAKFASRDLLHLKRGSNLSKYTQLLLGFTISGACHSIASIIASGSDGGKMGFFLAQFAAICVEDLLLEARKLCRFEAKPNQKWIGYCWVFLWFTFSLRSFVDRAIKDGAWDVRSYLIGPLLELSASQAYDLSRIQVFRS